MFPHHGVTNEEFYKSDHRPILIDTIYSERVQTMRCEAPKKFEAKWLCEESVEGIILDAWERAKDREPTLSGRTAEVHEELHRWDKNVLKGPRTRLKKLQRELNDVMTGPLSDGAVARQQELHMQIENLLEQEELFWVQRGKVNWLRHGDCNTVFFSWIRLCQKEEELYQETEKR